MNLATEADRVGFAAALHEAQSGYQEGGIPIGAALVTVQHGGSGVSVLGSGRNQRIQKSSPVLHAETDALENAGRLEAGIYKKCTMVRALVYQFPRWLRVTCGVYHLKELRRDSPCSMCAGAILLYKIPRVVIGENKTFTGEEELLRSRGVEVVVLDNSECISLMEKFITENPKVWQEDIGETNA